MLKAGDNEMKYEIKTQNIFGRKLSFGSPSDEKAYSSVDFYLELENNKYLMMR